MPHTEATDHDRAVAQVAREFTETKPNVKEVYARNVSGFDTPTLSVGDDDLVPDVYVVFANNREKLVEITDGDERDAGEQRRHETFQQSADAKPNVRSYEHYFVDEILSS